MKDPLTKENIRQQDEALLAHLGYRQEFKRDFSPLEVFGVAFSIIGIVPSIASVLFYAIPNGGGPSMVWGWLVASVFIQIVALAMADLASAAPTSGGLYWWTYTLSPPRWRRLLCWTVGYANTVGTVASVASTDWGCAVQIAAVVNLISTDTFEATNNQLFGIYVGVVLSHILLCCLATKILARLQIFSIFLNFFLCGFVIIALLAVTPASLRNTSKFALWDFNNTSGWPDGVAFLMSFLSPLWTIGAFDCGVHISEEVSNAARAVPWGIVNSVAVSGILGFVINLVLAFCMGTDMASLASSDQPLATIFLAALGHKMTFITWVFVIITQYMMGSSMLLACSRQTFAFSRDHALPFSRWLSRMNKFTGTPINAVVFDGILSILLGLMVYAGPQAINGIFALSLVGLYYAYAVPITVRFTGGQQLEPGPFSLGIMSLPISIAAVLFMALTSVIFAFPLAPQTNPESMNYTVVFFGGVMFLCLVWYYFPKYGAVHWFTGPVRNVDDLPEDSLKC